MARKKITERIKLTNNEKLNVYIDCKNVCAHCGRHLQFYHDMTTDHVIPLNKGGKNERRNYVALCEKCNQEKSDNVVYPIDYYPYLPEKKKQEVEELFNEYLQNTPWFAYDNLFMLDQFDLKTAKAVYMPKQHYCYPIETTMQVKKVNQDDAFDYLQLYIARLTPEDKTMFVTTPKELNTPYYKILDQGKCVMLISAYVDQQLDSNDKEVNVLRIDFFPNPEIKIREHITHRTICYILRSLIFHVHATLMNTARNTIIDAIFMTPHSDKLAAETLHEYERMFKTHCHFFENPNDDKDISNGGTIGIHMTLYQGTMQDMIKLADEHNVKSMYELAQVADKSKLQKPLDDALAESERRKENKPKYTHHKNDAKKHARKKRKK